VKITFTDTLTLEINDAWQRLQSTPEDPPESQAYGTATENCQCFLLVFPLDVRQTMPFDNPREVIDGIHNALADDQALIEVKSGNVGENRRIYSIIKTRQQPAGVQYALALDIATRNGAIRVQGFFDESGVTGTRDTVIYEMKRRDGTVGDDFAGWAADPYDSDIQKPYLMNLSEREEFDAMFPQHPLSVARQFVRELRV
jgi:hypothetical protein